MDLKRECKCYDDVQVRRKMQKGPNVNNKVGLLTFCRFGKIRRMPGLCAISQGLKKKYYHKT